MRLIIIACLLVASFNAKSDMTGAGDVAIVEQLIVIVEQTNQQIKQFQEMTDISKRLEEMESIKTVKKVTDQGEQIGHLIAELEETVSLVGDLQKDPGGLKDIERTIMYLEQDLNRADSKQGLEKAKAYSRLISDLKRLGFIQKANAMAMEQLAAGTNEEQNQQISTTNSTIMTDILVRREEREKIKASHEVKAVNELLRGNKYSSMVKSGGQYESGK
ncbi:MAG: hypothetical protein MI976_11415 [Pseudomonadales bacterium]|nr:hypothetical protein [Pseudomonadales bacterium]